MDTRFFWISLIFDNKKFEWHVKALEVYNSNITPPHTEKIMRTLAWIYFYVILLGHERKKKDHCYARSLAANPLFRLLLLHIAISMSRLSFTLCISFHCNSLGNSFPYQWEAYTTLRPYPLIYSTPFQYLSAAHPFFTLHIPISIYRKLFSRKLSNISIIYFTKGRIISILCFYKGP